MTLNHLVRNPIVTRREPDSKASMRAEHQTAVRHVSEEAAGIAAAASLIVKAVEEAAEYGGAISVQPQVNFLTGAMARLIKDWALAEHMQNHGAVLRRRFR